MNRGSLAVWARQLLRSIAGLLLIFSMSAALAQISYVSSTSADGGSSAQGSITLARPAGVLFADLLIAQISVNPASSSISAPSGWTLIDEVVSDNVRQRLYARSVANSEPVSYTFSLAPSARVAAGVVAMRGAEMISPVFSAYSERIGSSTLATANEVSVAIAGSALVAFFGADNGNNALTANPALTQAFADQSSAGPNGVSIVAGYQLGMAIGTTGTRSASIGSAVDWGAQMVALRPAVQTCFTDNFDRASLGADWAVTRRNGTFDPAIVSNRMRMTQADRNQSTAATLQRLVPADGNLVTIEFQQYAYGGNGADGIVFVLSDASVTPQPGAYGGSLGYANNDSLSGFAGGWMGVGIDEYGNYSRTNEGRRGLPTGWTTPNGIVAVPATSPLRPDAVVVRGSMPNYYFIAGTNSLSPGLDVTASGATGPGHSYRLTVDSRVAGEAWVTVERNTGSGYVVLIPRFNILAATSAQQDSSGARRTPENFLISITGSTGGSTHNHELDNLNICALALLPFTAQIDHFRFYHDGSARACQAEPVRLLACADAACSSLFAGSVAATLASAGGQWQDAGGNDLSGNVVSFSGGAVNLQLLRNSTGAETLAVLASTPPTKPLSVPKCYNSATNAQFTSCGLNFSDTQSFTFGVPPASSIPVQEAGVESAAVRIKATSSSCGGGTPTAFRNQVQPIQFAFAYLDPLQATVDGLIAVAANRPRLYLDPWEGNSGGVPSNSTQSFQRLDLTNISLNVYFNNSGEGYFQIVYPDVGQLRLSATGTGSIAGNSSFVVKPWEFMVDNVLRTADGVLNPAAADAAGAAFIAAGDDFSLHVTARNAPHKITNGSGSSVTNPVVTTPYDRTAKLFGKEQTAEGVRLASDAAALQPAGGANPALANADIPGGSFGSGANLGVASVSNLSWPEVGIISVQPRILPTGSETSGDYLGASDVTRYTSPNIGRFHPKEFALADIVFANRQALACSPVSTFSYFDEAMGLDFALEARSSSGSITRNYADAFARLGLPTGGATLSFAAARPAPGFAPLEARLAPTGFAGSWPAVGAIDGGRVSLSGQVAISSLNTPLGNRVAPDGPYLGAEIGLAPQDSDGVRIASYDLDSDNSGGAGGPDRRKVATTNLYFGQLRLMPAIGSERLPLAINAEVQRWMGTGFVPNGDDSCTSIPLARLGLRDWAGNLSAGETAIVSGAANFAAGRTTLRLSAPGAANSGRVNVTADLAGASLTYLGGRWPELPAVVDATPTRFDDAPWATAAFGLYRGVNQVIHRRENY
jgi:MSHA biogenesis protein MshQ